MWFTWGLMLTASSALFADDYVGGDTCAECHPTQVQQWRDSHHDRAMQVASEGTVLGDFNQQRFTYDGITTTFFRRGAQYFVNTDGVDGNLADFEVLFTFGVDPLQQYLVALPGGKLQALSIAWDARPATAGGQRWFHLYPTDGVTHGDALHWTRPAQNWNFMCAECHSTHLDKQVEPATGVYQTTWSDINVSCEACHGAGERHVADARRGGDAVAGLTHRFSRGSRWTPDSTTGMPVNTGVAVSRVELETCAACHARRTQLFEDDRNGQPLMQSFLPSLLEEGVYYADGQIDGEVYEYGSFVQSKMFAAGVTCSDCHEPHSLGLRAPGNGVCLQCHGAPQFDTPAHHFHPANSAGSACVSCHMPAKTYMQIDTRHDHSFRIPQPALTASAGVPNVCTDCHPDRDPSWATAQMKTWYGESSDGFQSYGPILHGARANLAGMENDLIGLLADKRQPGIARATAASYLSGYLNPAVIQALTDAATDDDPMVRASVMGSLDPLPQEWRYQILKETLDDPVRVVRVLAAAALADVPASGIPVSEQERMKRAGSEYLASMAFNSDDPSTWVNRGNYLLAGGDTPGAEAAYRRSMALDPYRVAGYINLADLMRRMGRDNEGQQILTAGIALLPGSADLHHSLGLLYVRQKNRGAAMLELKQAAELSPATARYAYIYAVALNSAGRTSTALAVIDGALHYLPGERSLLELRRSLRAETEQR